MAAPKWMRKKRRISWTAVNQLMLQIPQQKHWSLTELYTVWVIVHVLLYWKSVDRKAEESLFCSSYSRLPNSPNLLAGTLPPVQKNALHAFPALAPMEHEDLWPDFLGCLLRLLRPSQLQPHAQELPEPGMQPTARDLKRWATSSLLMETVIHVIVQLFRFASAWLAIWHVDYPHADPSKTTPSTIFKLHINQSL